MFFKTKLLLTIVIINLKSYMCYAGKTVNNNATNCLADVKDDFEELPTHINTTYVKSLYLNTSITDMRTYFSKFYFYNVSYFLKPFWHVESPLTVCSKKLPTGYASKFLKSSKQYDEYDKCIKEMTSIGLIMIHKTLGPTNEAEKNLKIFFLHYKISDLEHKNNAKEYMRYMSEGIQYTYAKLPGDFCLRKIEYVIKECRNHLSVDFNGFIGEIDRARLAIINKKKTDMKTKYGKLFYIDIRDRIQGVKGGYQSINQYCKDQGDKEIECKNELTKAGYEESFDYRSILLHTYYNIALNLPNEKIPKKLVVSVMKILRDLPLSKESPENGKNISFLKSFVLEVSNNFQLKKWQDEKVDFCESMVRYKLNLNVITTFQSPVEPFYVP